MATVTAYLAESEFAALSVQQFLSDNGVPAVVVCNEMPQEPGFRFGAGPWAYVVVDEPRAEEARGLALEFSGAVLGGTSGDAQFPSRIAVRTSGFLNPLLTLLVSAFLLQIGSRMYPGFPDDGVAATVWLPLIALLLSTTLLLAANPRIAKAAVAGLSMLPLVPLLPFALLYWWIAGLYRRAGTAVWPRS